MKVAEVLKTEGIIKASKDESLGAVLNNLSSSHDAAFVFEDDDFKKYLGVINPYYCLVKRFYPPETKVEKVLFHAPKLKLSDHLQRAARLMIESKVHYLPVFSDEGDKFLGIATARRILRRLLQTKRLEKDLNSVIAQKRPLITIYENDTLAKALGIFKSEKISKLVVVDPHGHLKGVLAYFDLIPLIVFPKEGASFGDRAGDKAKENFLSSKVKNYMKNLVLTLGLNSTLKEAAELILEKQIGSVVVVDRQNKPVNIITTRDILDFGFRPSAELEEFSEVEIKNVKEKHFSFIKTFVERLLKKAEKRKAKVKIWIEEEKHGGVIKMKVELEMKGERHYFTKEDKNIKKLLYKMDNALEEYL